MDIQIFEEAPSDVLPGSRVLLSGPLAPAEVRRVARATADQAGCRLAVDLIDLPDLDHLIADQGGHWAVVGWERWGELPVALIGTGSGIPMREAELNTLSAILPRSNTALRDRERLSRERVATRTNQLRRAKQRAERLDNRLQIQKARVLNRTRERDQARHRLTALESSREMRIGRSATALLRRVPGGRRGLIGGTVIGLLLISAIAVLVVVWPRVGLAVATLAGLLGVACAAGLHLLLALRARRVVTPAHRPDKAAVRRVERATLAAAAAHDELMEEVRRLQIEVSDARNSLSAIRGAAQRETERHASSTAASRAQIQATTQLFTMFSPEHRVPPMGGWAASPDLVLALIDELRGGRPRVVVECGSGVSTLWLALAIRKYGLDTKIISLDHNEHFAAMTAATLAQHGVDDIADVRIAPLTDVSLPGHDVAWYDPSCWQDLHDIGLLVVDGPPASTGVSARYPALPLLADKLAPTASVVMDDMIRADEQDIVRRWLSAMPEFDRVDLPLEKRATILRRQG